MNDPDPPGIPRHAVLAGVGCVAATYVYFLIFAEFALIELAKPLADGRLNWLMGTLAVGGVAGSFLAARFFSYERYARAVGTGFRACGAAAAFTLLAKSWFMMMLAGLCVGLGLGWLTVTLVSGLRGVVGPRRLGLWVGLATGVAYAICNLPWVFTASPTAQAIFAALVAVVGAIGAIWLDLTANPRDSRSDYTSPISWFWLAALLALVWLDSAAFYIIQHTESLRASTWEGPWLLGGNALMHLVAAVVAGVALDRGAAGWILVLAFGALGAACIALGDGSRAVLGAEIAYTAGVSLYSTALVTYPAHGGRPWVSARVYAVAGWGGSALGIGLAQDLHHVPLWFCGLAGVVVVGSVLARADWRRRFKGHLTTGWMVMIGLALFADSPLAAAAVEADLPAEGRRVFLSEGCMHCHSQYIRPRVRSDIERWGPARSLAESLVEQPPLLGNRRLGPDLTHVGNRRTPEWNRLHLIAPTSLNPGSKMPAYAHLFRTGETRGDALVAYLASLGPETLAERLRLRDSWWPALPEGKVPDQQTLLRVGRGRFSQLCAPCHGLEGRGDGPLAASLTQRPPDFHQPVWRHVSRDLDPVLRTTVLARLVKFGVPGTAMAGHEYLDDLTVVSLARTVEAYYLQPGSAP